MIKLIFILMTVVILASSNAFPITKVGNGNDGDDLLTYSEIREGPILISRLKAIELLKKTNTNSIAKLGNLLSEVRNTKLLMINENLSPEAIKKLGGNEKGKNIFARTYPKPNAATKFFPHVKKLNEKQLVALHIHEGLHRALPKSMRENEKIVEEITMAITDPETTNDLIASVVQSSEVDEVKNIQSSTKRNYENVSFEKFDEKVVKKSKLNNPSTIGISQSILVNPNIESNNKVNGITTLQSYLFPFGKNKRVLGVGIDLNLLEMEGGNYLGPIGLSLRSLVFTRRGFDAELFAKASINSISDEEFTNSYLGRDAYTVGMGLKYNDGNMYIQNDLAYTFESKTSQTVGPTNITYQFGDIISTHLKAGTSVGNLDLGGVIEVFLAGESIEKDDVNYVDRQDNLRIVTIGPELTYHFNNFQVQGSFKYKVDSTSNVGLEQLGNITGFGAGNGNFSLGAKYKF